MLFRGRSRTPVTHKMEIFVIIVIGSSFCHKELAPEMLLAFSLSQPKFATMLLALDLSTKFWHMALGPALIPPPASSTIL